MAASVGGRIGGRFKQSIPSREWIHIPPGEKENHLEIAIFGGYVNSLEGTPWKMNGWNTMIQVGDDDFPLQIGSFLGSSRFQP